MEHESWFEKLLHAVFGHPRNREAEEAFMKKAAAHPELHWKTSIIDLMTLADMDSGLEARIRLARELHYPGSLDGSAAMNEFLHEKVMERLGITHGEHR